MRAVVITGSGRAFCAGQDLKEHLQLVAANDPRLADTVSEFFNPVVRLLADMGKPVIAAVNGPAAGAGTGLAAACDLRVAARSAVFRTSFAGVALSADTGLSFHLPRLVGAGRAMRMLLLDEPVTAETALDIGLVDQVVDDAELPGGRGALAAELAAGPTAGVRLDRPVGAVRGRRTPWTRRWTSRTAPRPPASPVPTIEKRSGPSSTSGAPTFTGS